VSGADFPGFNLVFFLFYGLAGAQTGEQRAYLCEDIKKPFFSAAAEGVFSAQRRMAMPEKFSPKPAGVKRVFIVGESVAGILGPGKSVLGGLARACRGAGSPYKNGHEMISRS